MYDIKKLSNQIFNNNYVDKSDKFKLKFLIYSPDNTSILLLFDVF